MGLLSRLFDPDARDTRRGAPPVPGGPPPPPPSMGDDPVALLRSNAELVTEINRSSGELPTVGIVLALQITDAVESIVVRHGDEVGLSTRLSVRGVVADYLPTTIRTYVAATRHASSDEQRTQARDQLVEQLTLMRGAVEEILDAASRRDAQALEVQGTFLDNKFRQGDLDL